MHLPIYLSIYPSIYLSIYLSIIILFAMLRKLFIYLPFSVKYGKKSFFSIVGKNLNSVVDLSLPFYLFMLLVRNFLILERLFQTSFDSIV